MKFYPERTNQQVDLVGLKTLIRQGYVYSISVVSVDGRFELQAEVVVQGEGIRSLQLSFHGHASFSDESESNRHLLDALKAEPSSVLDWHLTHPGSDRLLCDAQSSKKQDFPSAPIDDFFSSTAVLPGPRCERCRVTAHALALVPSK